MESLSEEVWDVVIVGTSLPQSLLAFYYGGTDAGLNLAEASAWVKDLEDRGSNIFSNASLESLQHKSSSGTPLASSRSYTLSLHPQIIYASSAFLPTLISSQIHTQLEFLAVGSWWIYRNGQIHKIPSTREDVFEDEAISRRDKTNLMKFLRFVLQDEDDQETDEPSLCQKSLKSALDSRFNVSEPLRTALLALALSSEPATSTDFKFAVQRIKRHMKSIGYFGPGFGAVFAKYGGNAEISQVACRSQAVGGGVYLLGHALKDIKAEDRSGVSETTGSMSAGKLLRLTLSDGTGVESKLVVGGIDDLPNTTNEVIPDTTSTIHSVDIVSSPLKQLFPPTSEGGPSPAVTIVLVDDGYTEESRPIYLQIHSEDTGECPAGQCIIYGSVRQTDEMSQARLRRAVQDFLACDAAGGPADILWSLTYTLAGQPPFHNANSDRFIPLSDQVLMFRPQTDSVSFDDEVLNDVKSVWEKIMVSAAADRTFLRFEAREQDSDN